MLLYFVYFAKHSQGTWLWQEVAQSTTSLIFPAQTPAPASASYQLLITSACSMQHATSNCERENNYERTKNSLEDEEDSYSGHRKHVPSRFLRLISMHAHTHTHTLGYAHTHTAHMPAHAWWCACKSIKVFVSSGLISLLLSPLAVRQVQIWNALRVVHCEQKTFI